MDLSHGSRYMTITSSTGAIVRARRIIACAGLYADKVAGIMGGDATKPTIVPFRGTWMMMKPEFRSTLSHLTVEWLALANNVMFTDRYRETKHLSCAQS